VIAMQFVFKFILHQCFIHHMAVTLYCTVLRVSICTLFILPSFLFMSATATLSFFFCVLVCFLYLSLFLFCYINSSFLSSMHACKTPLEHIRWPQRRMRFRKCEMLYYNLRSIDRRTCEKHD
jgi:hypothetical protein